MPEETSQSLAEMDLVKISVEKLVELVDDWTTKFRSKMGEEPGEVIERAFSEHCYLAVMRGHINVALRNPNPAAGMWARAVKVKMRVDQAVVEGRTFRFGSGTGGVE
jgi:hypothetical protein